MTIDTDDVSKINFSNINDFKFLAAFEKYSEVFDKANNEDRRSLNKYISELYDDEITYSEFYFRINNFVDDPEEGRRFGRASIKGQRKKAYRREQQKKRRIERHR